MRPALSSTLAGFGTTIFSEMTRLANEHGAINLAQGFPDFDGPEFVEGGGDRGDPRRAGPVRARVRHPRDPPRALGQVPARLGSRLRAGHGDRRDVRRDGGDLRGDPGPLRRGRRGRPVRAVLRLLQGERVDGGRRPARRDAAHPRLELRSRGARRRVRSTHAGDPPQHAPQSDRQGLLAGRAGGRSRGSAASATSSASPTRSTSTSCTRAATSRWRRCPACASARSRSRRFGKTFSLTGWRIGWAMAPPRARRPPCASAHQFITFATATPLQYGAAPALDAGPTTTPRCRRTTAGKRDYLAAGALADRFRA